MKLITYYQYVIKANLERVYFIILAGIKMLSSVPDDQGFLRC
jgi:hypothetical protein